MIRGVTVHFLAHPSLFILTPNQIKPMQAPAQQACVYNKERLNLTRVYPYSIYPCFTNSSLSPYPQWAYFWQCFFLSPSIRELFPVTRMSFSSLYSTWIIITFLKYTEKDQFWSGKRQYYFLSLFVNFNFHFM